MTKTRTWSLGTTAVCVLLAVAAWFLLISPTRSEAASLRDQKVQQDQANDQTRMSIKQLKAQYAELPAKQAELAVIKQQMPDNPALPTLIRNLTTMAKAAGVTLVSVAPAPPVTYNGTTGATGTPQAKPAATAATPSAGAAAAPSGMVQASIATTIVVKGDYSEATLFLQKVQAQMRRAFLVNTLQLAPDAGSGTAASSTPKGNVQMTITGQVFVLKTPAVTAPVVPAAG